MAQEIEGMITRDVLPYGAENAGVKPWAQRVRMDFCTTPVSHEVARAHLELHAPNGRIVISRRGPRGGWTYLRFAVKPEGLPRHMKDRTLHIAKEHYEIYRGEIGKVNGMTYVHIDSLTQSP